MASISLIDLSKQFGAVVALDRVSLQIGEGEFVSILGPSGSGKTTILSLIAGLADPSGGVILFDGRDVTGLPPARRDIGVVFQSYALFPHLCVYDNVAFPLSVRRLPDGEIRRRVGEALALLHLDGLETRRPNQLSGGQQQRVALARALVFEPDVLLLDEPMSALDRGLREEVRVELRLLQRRLGVTTILVTHDQEEALFLSDRVAVLAEGRLQQVATPQEAYRRPSNAFVASFLGAANIVEGRVEIGPGGRPCLRTPAGDLLQGSLTTSAREGDTVRCVIRPEELRLTAANGSECGLRAVVDDVGFFGHTIRCHLRTAAGQPLVAVGTAADVARYRCGDPVMVTCNHDDLWVLPEPDGGSRLPGPRRGR